MIKLGIVGCGHWGKNYLRIFSFLSGCRVKYCVDSQNKAFVNFKKQYPGIVFTSNFKKMTDDKEIKAVIVSTPASTHYLLGKKILNAGKDLLMEKPLALNPDEAEELVELAKKKKRILMVGHTFLYNSAVRSMRKYIRNGKIGKIYYIQAVRTHLGLIREDVNAVWDLAPHDVSIFNYLIGDMPEFVSAVGGNFLRKGREDVAFITLKYPNGILGNIHVSWADSNKVRRVQAVGSKARIVFDDLDNLEKLKIYEKGIATNLSYTDFGEFQYVLRDGDIFSPKIDQSEPLKEQCRHFIECLKENKNPLTDGKNGLEVVRVMEGIHSSIKNNGRLERI